MYGIHLQQESVIPWVTGSMTPPPQGFPNPLASAGSLRLRSCFSFKLPSQEAASALTPGSCRRTCLSLSSSSQAWPPSLHCHPQSISSPSLPAPLVCCQHLPGWLQWTPQGPPTSQFPIFTSAEVIILGHKSGIIPLSLESLPETPIYLRCSLPGLTEVWLRSPSMSALSCVASFHPLRARLSQPLPGHCAPVLPPAEPPGPCSLI